MKELGMKHFALFYQPLFVMWMWRYANEDKSLWQMVIQCKYSSDEGDWTTKEVRGTYRGGAMEEH